MSEPTPYDKLVLTEGGFEVELSNHGRKLMFNPNPTNLEKKVVKCIICGKPNTNMFSLCMEHNANKKKNHLHKADWFGRLIPPNYARADVISDVLPHYQITETMIKWMNKEGVAAVKTTDEFVKATLNSVVSYVPDATTLQIQLAERDLAVMAPDDVVVLVNKLVDAHFPKAKYGNSVIDAGKFNKKILKNMPVRIAASLLVLAWACEESNRGDAWFCRIHNRESKYGNAYMPSVYYFLRRYTNATAKQTRICLK